ncbi:MAG: NRDE family protein [Deltaproteobacteria bacterium]|nr:NRDE family protein [Deltaproteobacteria bacterium]MBI2182328.1 NRDE family protein [Deltaproteobacteria bacterium]MBI2230521.1 NRDE family protein [Deltaproteobacteria bacterium]MBI2532646.1 NRDE family protein [Deltaproteobacteria bacterium]
MCTLALYFKSFEGYPLVVAANRDEHYDRPSAPPTLLNADPAILAGRDLRAGGTWLGVNEHGLLAGILNRRTNGEPEPGPGTRSRGLLCLDILALKTAAEACGFLQTLGEVYQPFTLLCADADEAWSAYNRGGQIKTHSLGPGLHVFSSATESDASSDKRDRAYVRFAGLAEDLRTDRAVGADGFLRLRETLGDHTLGDGSSDPRDAICMHGESAGTVSSSIVVYSRRERRVRTFFCSGAPCRNVFGSAMDLDLR